MSAEERDSQVIAKLEPIIQSINTNENILSLFKTMGAFLYPVTRILF